MSPTILFIALLHGAVVVIVAATTRSRIWSAIAAILAGGVGLATGNPAYAVVDLLAVAGALYFCWSGLPQREKTPKPVIATPAVGTKPARSRWVNGVVRGGMAAAAIMALCAGAALFATQPAEEVPVAARTSSSRPSAGGVSSGGGFSSKACSGFKSQESRAACLAATR